MSSHKIEEKLLSLFSKILFETYVKKFGYSISQIDKHEIPLTFRIPSKKFYVKSLGREIVNTGLYFSEMQARGYLSQERGIFKFTVSGYQFGYESSHPYKSFHKKHWQWLYGVLFVGLLAAASTLLASLLSNSVCTSLSKIIGS